MASNATTLDTPAAQLRTFSLPPEDPETTRKLTRLEDLSQAHPWITTTEFTELPGYETHDTRPPIISMSQHESATLFTNSWKFTTLIESIFRILTQEDTEKLTDLVTHYSQQPRSTTLHDTLEDAEDQYNSIELRKADLLHNISELNDFQSARKVRENVFEIFSLRESKFIGNVELPSTPIEIEPFARFQLEKNVPKHFGNPFTDVLFQLVKDFIVYSIKSIQPEEYDDNMQDGAITRVFNTFWYSNRTRLWPYPELRSVPGHSLYLYTLLFDVLSHDNLLINEPELPLPFFESGKRLTEDRFASIIAVAARMLLTILQQNRNT